jgi:electron transfer flavoprotein alpha subunit
MGDILAFAEQKAGQVRAAANEVVSAAAAKSAELGGSAHALILGGPGVGDAAGGLGAYGASSVRVAKDEALAEYSPAVYAAVVAEAARAGSYDALLFPATAQGKDLAPRVAALLDAPMAADITRLEVDGGKLVAVRPIYSGKALARITFQSSPCVLSLRPNLFGAEETGGAGSVEALSPTIRADNGMRTVEFQAAEGGSVDVSEASVVVAGGRGLKEAEHWKLLEDLRDALGPGTALGASRAVVDAGWRPHSEQVGQTGKTVAPALYFAVGISGAIQHLVGMRASQTIVAVNKDADAPIFGVADYGIVGDAFEVLPRLTQAIEALRAEG